MATLAFTRQSAPRRGILSMSGDVKVVLGTVTFSGSYATGGETVDLPASWGGVKSVIAMFLNPTGGYVFEYVDSTKKVKAYRQTAATSALVEVAAAVNVGAVGAVPFVAFCT